MAEEKVYFPGHKLSLNNSEFILNSPVLFTVQAINVFITGGLSGFWHGALCLAASEAFPSPSWKTLLPTNADLHKLFPNFHWRGSEKGLLIREVNPRRFRCQSSKRNREFTNYSLVGRSVQNEFCSGVSSRAGDQAVGPDPPLPHVQGALQITWSLERSPFSHSDLQNFPSSRVCAFGLIY